MSQFCKDNSPLMPTHEYSSNRDLIKEIGEELKKYDIDLYLYYTGDGPHKDEQAGNGLGWYDGDPNGKKECFCKQQKFFPQRPQTHNQASHPLPSKG